MEETPLKVLAIDDEQLLLSALERAGRGCALDIRTAETTGQALAELERCQYDLLMLDFDLHDPAHLERLRAIDDCCPSVPIIVMTTADRKSCEVNEAIRTSRRQGAWHLLEKPFSLDTMLSFVEVIFQKPGPTKLCQPLPATSYDLEKRGKLRRPYVQPVKFSFSSIVGSGTQRTSTTGILTDISDGGSGVLTRAQVSADQVISFEDEFMKLCGVVAWSVMLDQVTCRFGVQFY